jgi:flagellar operon protein
MKVSNNNSNQFLSIEQLQDTYLRQQKVSTDSSTKGTGFDEILQQRLDTTKDKKESIKFSKHAANRLSDRNIELTDEQLERLNDGMKMASQKGIKDSLVLVDSLAFIVNTKSNTVITAMDQTQTDSNIYTNIDGAVII